MPSLPAPDHVNEAGGAAYKLAPEHALAQFAATGCLNSTFYASASEQLAAVIELCETVSPEFIAKAAIFARERGHLKDMPALLCALLSVRSPEHLTVVFWRVIDTPKMLRNFVQIMRSGVVGRKSLGSLPKRLVLEWLAKRSTRQLFVGSIGQDPSLADIVKMVHPKPLTPERDALFGYLLGRMHEFDHLPQVVKEYESFKSSPAADKVPDIPFQFLTSMKLSRQVWVEIARRAPWQMTRMNLNTFLRHGVFEVDGMVELIAERPSKS